MIKINDYVIGDLSDAEMVLTLLIEFAEDYGNVSLADYYDLIGVTSRYLDSTVGWTSDIIKDADIVKILIGETTGYRNKLTFNHKGYLIKLPPVVRFY